MDVRLVLRLMLVLVFITGSIVESINITTDPVKCSGRSNCKLNCNIGEITDTVKWLYNGTNIFNCSSPYSAGLCSMSNNINININITSGSTSVRTYIYRGYHEGVWICIHGNERATFDIKIVDPAIVTSFETSLSGSQGHEFILNCSVRSTVPVDVNITATDSKQHRVILYQVKQSSLRTVTTRVKADGEYQVFRCEVWNGYGYKYTRMYYLSSTYRASVKSYQISSTGSEGDLLNLNCTVTSKLPVDVNITVKGLREEKIILTQVKKSSLRSITTTVKAGCGYQNFRCEVWNGYGSVYTRSYSRRYKCPLQILYDQTNTTVEGVVGTYYTYFWLYYTGYPGTPTSTWYRRDGNHEIKLNGYRVSHGAGSQYLVMYIRYVHIQDAGQYSIHVNISGRIEIVVFTLNVKMPKLSTDALNDTTSMNPSSTQSTQVMTVAENTAQSLHQSDEQPFSSTTGIGIGVGIGVVGTLTLVGIIVLVVWLKHRRNLTTDTCPTMQSLERNARKTKNTTKAGVDNVNMEELYDNADENIEYENHYVS